MSALTKTSLPVRPLAELPPVNAAVALLAVVAVAMAVRGTFGFGASFVYTAGGLFAGVAAAVSLLAARHLSTAAFGPANRVTLMRAALVALLAGLIAETQRPLVAWGIVPLALSVLILDGVDGKLARSHGASSRFGARFDMETDAALILVMTVLAWQLDKAGAWILAGGLLRYGFVLATRVLPFMRGELPYSRRRQVVCVVQIVSLLVCLAPFIPQPLSGLAALLGLLALTGSFAIDAAWLARRAA